MTQLEIIKLTVPKKVGDKEITELQLRRPDSGALRGLSLSDIIRMEVDALADLAPRLCKDLNKGMFYELDPYDVMRIGKAINGFLTQPPSD